MSGYETMVVPNPDHLHKFELSDGGTAHVMLDRDGSSPREWDNVTEMFTASSRYLDPDGDDTDSSVTRALQDMHGTLDEDEVKAALSGTYESVEAYDAAMAEAGEDAAKVLVVSATYEWGTGRAIKAMSTFDYGDHGEATGYAIIWQDKWDAEFAGVPDEQQPDPQDAIKAEVDIYKGYVEGNVYGVVIVDAEGTEVESTWGYHGYDYDDPAIVTDNFDVEIAEGSGA